MIYELRTYVAAPGRAERLHERFRRHTLDIFRRCGIEVVGFWTEIADPARFVYVARFASEAARDAAWRRFAADAEWKRVQQESERDGALASAMMSVALRPVDYFAPGAGA